MRKKLAKYILLISTLVMASIPSLALADTPETNEYTHQLTTQDADVEVTATVSDNNISTYKVILPALINLRINSDNFKYESDYQVGAKGYLPENRKVVVKPRSTFDMVAATSGESSTAYVTQPITQWLRTPIENLAKELKRTEYTYSDGNVSVELTEEDSYTGNLIFDFFLTDKNVGYSVIHQQEQLNGSYETVETEQFDGETGDHVTPDTKEYPGFTSPSTQEIIVNDTGTESVTYKYARNSYTLTVNKGAGIESVTGNGEYKYEAPVNVGYTLANGYDFDTWTGDKTSNTFAMPASNITMQANAKIHEYNIIYDLNGGSVTVNPTTYNVETDSFTLNNPTKEGFEFTGWTWSNGTTPQKTVTITKGSTGDLSYKANWTPNYTISYNLDGGSVTGNPTTYNAETDSFTLNNPTRKYYIFAGWSGTGLTGTTNKTVTITKGTTGNLSYTANWIYDTDTALKFSSDNDFTLKANNGKTWNGTLEYTTDDGDTWTEWDGSELSGTADQPIYLRGIGNTVITGGNSENKWLFTGKYCTGNIENLLDYQKVANNGHPTLAENCYRSMFYSCTSLATAPELPATTLAPYCYQHMFYNCTALTTAPELPATTLAEECYRSMFNGCTSLTTAPERLPAMTLAGGCYRSMFQDCASLTTAPALPATTLATDCYKSMFYNCTSLTTSPELPATTLADGCYNCMFYGCTSLTTAPALPATTLAESCYRNMFQGCTSLTTAPALPATTLADSCYLGMLYNCTSLTTAPELPATTLAPYCYQGMFYGCTSITTAPELHATKLATKCYYSMFSGCTSLATAPELPATTMGEYCYSYMFYNCKSLTTAPELPATTLAPYCYQQMFKGCTYLTTAPERLPAMTLANSCYAWMFEGCTSLTTAPALPATTLVENCYKSMFYGCASLAIAPELPATTLAENCYRSMFYNCTSLTTSPELPATTLANSCYIYMFYNCTSLTASPELPATTLAPYCYQQMFEKCTILTTAPELPATTLDVGCYQWMFANCTSLAVSNTQTDEYRYAYRVPMVGTGTTASDALKSMFYNTGGTFKGTPAINTTYYMTNPPV